MFTKRSLRILASGALMLVFGLSCTRESEPDAAKENQNATKPTSEVRSDPCALLTKEEVAGVLKVEVSESRLESYPRPNCRYTSARGEVVVFLFTDPSAKGGFNIGKTEQDANTRPVSGVGDEAYWSPGIMTLNVLKGDAYFTVQFLDAGGARSLDEAIELAQKAAGRLS